MPYNLCDSVQLVCTGTVLVHNMHLDNMLPHLIVCTIPYLTGSSTNKVNASAGNTVQQSPAAALLKSIATASNPL